MLFNSFAFAIFLPIVFILYWALPHKFRWIVILISSCYFYMSWNPKYIVLILFTTFVSYLCGIGLEKTDKPKVKKWIMTATLVVSLGLLFFFKYFNFFSENITVLCQKLALPIHPVTLSIMLPVGISFYTFQTIGYVIDVYRGDIAAERHFGKYAAFISFFPQLVAGPIERTKNLLPQIKSEHTFSYEKAAVGMRLIAWGYFKKLVIADNMAIYVDQVYNDLSSYDGCALLFATFCFAFQIYGDFSGYSDIAIGVAKLFDIQLMTNFKSPYCSASIKEFWSRWHISLSTWFKDYIYIPLGGNRVGRFRHCFNLFITFLISGLWHGANWTFVVWGGIHGILQCAQTILFPKKKEPRKHRVPWFLRVCGIFILVGFAWIFFRANNLSDAFYVLGNMFNGIDNPLAYLNACYESIAVSRNTWIKLAIMLALLGGYDFLSLKHDLPEESSKLPFVVRWLCYYLLLFFILWLMPMESSQFIYFEF